MSELKPSSRRFGGKPSKYQWKTWQAVLVVIGLCGLAIFAVVEGTQQQAAQQAAYHQAHPAFAITPSIMIGIISVEYITHAVFLVQSPTVQHGFLNVSISPDISATGQYFIIHPWTGTVQNGNNSIDVQITISQPIPCTALRGVICNGIDGNYFQITPEWSQ